MHHNVSYVVVLNNISTMLARRVAGKKAEAIDELRGLFGNTLASTHSERSIRMRPDQYALCAYLLDRLDVKPIRVGRVDNQFSSGADYDITGREIKTWWQQSDFVRPASALTAQQRETMIGVLNDIDYLNKATSGMENKADVKIEGVTFRTVDLIPMFAARRERAIEFLPNACDLIFRKEKSSEVQQYTEI